jgi:hypothetical protein
MSKLRLSLAVVLLLISLVFLGWGVWPAWRERHVLRVPPALMTLPTPASYLSSPFDVG